MAHRPLSERLAAERERAAKAQERVRRLEKQERATERANQKRREALLGMLVLDELKRETAMAGELRRWLHERLPNTLTRDRDREIMAAFLPATNDAAITDAASSPQSQSEGDSDDR